MFNVRFSSQELGSNLDIANANGLQMYEPKFYREPKQQDLDLWWKRKDEEPHLPCDEPKDFSMPDL